VWGLCAAGLTAAGGQEVPPTVGSNRDGAVALCLSYKLAISYAWLHCVLCVVCCVLCVVCCVLCVVCISCYQ